MPTSPLARLDGFRSQLHACFTGRADALFQLGDALLCAQLPLLSLPHLSLEPTCRRGWGSVYAALARGAVDAERLRELLVSVLASADPPVFVVDVTSWPRCDAECYPSAATTTIPRAFGRSADHRRLGLPVDLPAQLRPRLLTAPVDARRLHPWEDTDHTAAAQIRALLDRLDANGRVPLLVFDAG